MTLLPTPTVDGAVPWVAEHLGDLALEGPDGVVASARFTGGQSAAEVALNAFDVTGYASRRSEVLPATARGASALSPYVRHGLLPLPRLWEHVADGPRQDAAKYRDELLWQEYSRHLYARVGREIAAPLRREPAVGIGWEGEPYRQDMACMAEVRRELITDGWLVNQARLWAASQYTVRAGGDFREGARALYRHLVDGSPAANGVGWQWAVGSATGKAYGFSRWQVEKRAPTLCAGCALNRCCPIQDFPEAQPGGQVPSPDGFASDPDPAATAGPAEPRVTGEPEAVWLTAESLGDDDPALAAHPQLPAVFVFDAPLLAGLRLSSKRLVFLTQCLADLAQRRPVEVHRGAPARVLAGRPLAVTYAPVPGFRTRSAALDVAALHPWLWLRRPAGGSARSFTSWVGKHGGSPSHGGAHRSSGPGRQGGGRRRAPARGRSR